MSSLTEGKEMGLNVRRAGELERGVMVALMGERGAGKTTLAASFPEPRGLAVEDGTQALAEFGTAVVDVDGTKDEMLRTLREVAKSDYRTVVVDSTTALLSRMTAALVAGEPEHARSLMAALGGYGKARDVLVRQVEEIVDACLWLARERRTHVVWVLHQKLGTVSMPDRGDFDRVVPEGQRDAVAAILNPCDLVGMVEQKVTTVKSGEKVLVRGDGSRQLVTGPHPAYSTKSRFHREFTTLPVEFGVNPLPDIVR